MMPSPPSWAMAIAIGASVTVSIAADRPGIRRLIDLVSRALTSTSEGRTSDFWGTRRTSSNVSASGVRSSSIRPPDQFVPWHFLYFLPLPQGHGSLRPTLGPSRLTVWTVSVPPSASRGAALANDDFASLGLLKLRLRGSDRDPASASSASRARAATGGGLLRPRPGSRTPGPPRPLSSSGVPPPDSPPSPPPSLPNTGWYR